MAPQLMVTKGPSERGEPEVDDVEPVVEILAEVAGADLLLQVAVGRGDDADVDLLRLALADALELALLEHPQQLDLQLGAHAGDFVEEDGAAVGGLEAAGLVLDGPGERPLDVAEQLALQQALGQRPAVDPHVGAVGPPAEAVQGAGDHLLAGAGLAHQQHAGRRRRHPPGQPVHLAHGRRRADDAGQFVVGPCPVRGVR